MYYENLFVEDEKNQIRIPALVGLKSPYWYDGNIIDDMISDEYYYQLTIFTDNNDCFDYLEVYKVGGADSDSAHGGEYYEELEEDEIRDIINFIMGLFELSEWKASATYSKENDLKKFDFDFVLPTSLYENINEYIKKTSY